MQGPILTLSGLSFVVEQLCYGKGFNEVLAII